MNLRIHLILIALLNFNISEAQEVYIAEGQSAKVQLRTNGLYDMAACLNIGGEIQTDLGLAWQLDYISAWWNNKDRNRYYSNYAFQTEIRYYTDSKNQTMPYTGHHIGVYGQMVSYDFEFGGTGYQSSNLDHSWGIGLSYGYSIVLSRKFSMDFTAGIGFFRSKYDVYEPTEYNYHRTDTKVLKFFGPTKLEATLIWNINGENHKKKGYGY